MTRLGLDLCLVVLSILLAIPTVLAQESDSPVSPGEISALRALADEYRSLDRYRDEGTIEINTFQDGTEHTTRIAFATRISPMGFQMELWPETGSQSVLWTRGRRPLGKALEQELGQKLGQAREVFRYDARARQFALLPSFHDALPRSFGPAVRDALLVPRWLLGVLPPDETAGAGISGLSGEPTVETGQPCEDSASDRPEDVDRPVGEPSPVPQCRVLTWTSPPSQRDQRLRVWVGEDDGRIRRVEMERGPAEDELAAKDELAGEDAPVAGFASSRAWTWVEVVHTPREPEDDPAPFLLPPDAQRVARLPEPPGPLRPEGRTGIPDVPDTFSDTIRVLELLLPVQVVDREGHPLPGLSAEDFRLRVDGQDVPVQAATWRDPRDPWVTELAAMSAEERKEAGVEHVVPGRLVVLFFQTDVHAVRIKGHMAFLPKLRELLDALAPTDRLALASYDSHLKLWHDFTTDHQAILDLVKDAFRFGAKPGSVRPGKVSESLAEHFDFAAAKDAAFVEEGLAVLARAMEPFIADKVMFFVGWGVGHNGTQALREGYRALFEADVTLHALDVTYVDGIGPAHGGHTLAAPLSAMAQTTGGTYVATHMFPDFAVRAVAVALQGHYELSVLESDLPPAGGKIEIELRDPRKGQIYNPGGIPHLGPAGGNDK